MNASKEYAKRLILCGVYAPFFTICIYKNPWGIMWPFFAAATLIAYFIVFNMVNKDGLYRIKKYSYVLMGFILLLSIHICTTRSEPLLLFDKLFIFISFFVLFLTNLYDDKTWDVSKYFIAITSTIFTSLGYFLNPITEGINVKKYGTLTAPEPTHPTWPGQPMPQGQGVVPGQAPVPQNMPAQPPVPQAAQPAMQTGEESEKKKGTIGYVILGLVISIPLLCIVLPLLASSDAVFNSALTKVFDFELDEDFFKAGILTVLIFIYGYALMCRLLDKSDYVAEPVTDKRNANPAITITISSVLLFFYIIYCGIQIIYLFLGFGTLPKGYTYADYAHEGFFQLVFVCLINLVLVLVCRKYTKDNKVLKILLTVICICTYVMLFSSAYRMILYISVYGLTFLRVYVLWALVVIALVMAGAIALIFSAKVPFVKYSLTLLVATWLIFSFSYPDKIIAEYNMSNGYDMYYTANDLSADAIPVLMKYSDKIDAWYDYNSEHSAVKGYEYRWKDARLDIRTFNFSEYAAVRAVN